MADAAEPAADVADAVDPAADVADAVDPAADVADAAEPAADVAEAVADAADAPAITDLLTVEGFDYDKVAEYIDASDLGVIAKTGAKALLDQAKSNPDALQGVLEQLKSQLGL